MNTPYVMESAREGRRLRAAEAAHPSRDRLLATGLGPGMRVADVGCGAGAVLSAILEIVGEAGEVVGLDPNASRLAEAHALLGAHRNLRLQEASLPRTGLPDSNFDYVWCQYVLEYIGDPHSALEELKRISRPGGRVVVTEIDGHGLHTWPFPENLQEGAQRMVRALAKTGFDLYCGRKMFHLFRTAGFRDVRVQLWPLYVAAGRADEQLIEDWQIRFEALAPLAIDQFGGAEAYQRFTRDYLQLLADPDALKYAFILTTTGTKA